MTILNYRAKLSLDKAFFPKNTEKEDIFSFLVILFSPMSRHLAVGMPLPAHYLLNLKEFCLEKRAAVGTYTSEWSVHSNISSCALHSPNLNTRDALLSMLY